MAEGKIDTEDLSQEDDRHAFKQGGAVLVGRSTDRQHEARDLGRQLEHVLGSFQRDRQGGVRRGGRESVQINFLTLAEELEGRNSADDFQHQAIHHEELEEQANEHHGGVERDVAEETGAHAVGGVEDDAEDRVRCELHGQFDDLHAGLEDRIEDLRERVIFALDDRRQRPAEEQGEDHQGDDFTLEGTRGGIDRVLREQIHKELIPCLVLRSGDVLLDGQHALVGGQSRLIELEADARLEPAGREHGDEHRTAAQQDGVQQREAADPAETGATPEFHGAEH